MTYFNIVKTVVNLFLNSVLTRFIKIFIANTVKLTFESSFGGSGKNMGNNETTLESKGIFIRTQVNLNTAALV